MIVWINQLSTIIVSSPCHLHNENYVTHSVQRVATNLCKSDMKSLHILRRRVTNVVTSAKPLSFTAGQPVCLSFRTSWRTGSIRCVRALRLTYLLHEE